MSNSNGKEDEPLRHRPRLINGDELLRACKKLRLPVGYLQVANELGLTSGRLTTISFGPDDDRQKHVKIYWTKEPSERNLNRVSQLVKDRLGASVTLSTTHQDGPFYKEREKESAPAHKELRQDYDPEVICALLPPQMYINIDVPLIGSDCADPQIQKFIEGLRAELPRQPAIKDLAASTIFMNTIGSSFMSMNVLVNWLVRVSLAHGPQIALEYLHSLVSSETMECLEVLYLSGINVKQEIELPEDITLHPLEKREEDNFSSDKEFGSRFPYTETSAVLAKTVKIPKLTSRTHPSLPEEVYRVHEMLRDVSRVLVLAGAGPAVVERKRSFGPEWHPIDAPGNLPTGIDPLSSVDHKRFYPACPQEVKNIVSSFLSCPESFRKRLRLPLSKLSTAFRRRAFEEIALDLGTALECILAEGLDNQQSISHAVRTRGALILGGDLDQKKRTREMLSKIYNLRSKATHAGVVDNTVSFYKREPVFTGYVLQDGLELCSQIILKIIEHKAFPDWDELELLGSWKEDSVKSKADLSEATPPKDSEPSSETERHRATS